MEVKFIADVHLGKLARYLRLLGFDTRYKNSVTNSELKSLASSENRILLSKNELFADDTSFKSCIIKAEDSFLQLQQVIREFTLKEDFKAFSRCMICNSLLKAVEKNTVEEKLEDNTARYYHEFWQCTGCKRVYWKGAHYKRMMQLIEEIKISF
jgi:uncharacterized protein